jgi:ribosomal protein L11 methyltransferase
MTTTLTPATRRASFAIGSEQVAKRVVDLLNESFFEGQAAISAFEGAGGRWHISVHFAEPPDEGSIRELVGLAAGDDIARDIAFDTVEAKDWVKATLEELVPVRAGRFIVHGRHDRAKVPPNKIGIEIEAALAFGTGHHGTTRGCLLLLDEVLKAWLPRRVLDLGTGTGVLGIAAAKALQIKVLASDIDPLSVRVAAENARLNGTGDLVETIRATGFSAPQFAERGPFDLVLANILANPLRQMATPMARHLAPSALVILSGLLPHQASGVVAAYRARGLVLVRQLRIEGWSSLLLRNAK